MVEAPEKIWAKTHGASTDVISGKRGLIGGWNEHQRDGQIEYVRADLVTDKADAWDAVAAKNTHIADLERQIAELRAEYGELLTTWAEPRTVSLSDPSMILAGIKQFGLAPDGADIRDLERTLASQAATIRQMREALERIRDFPKPGTSRRTEDGYPDEIAYDEFAYRRIVDSYRECARAALNGGSDHG